MFKSKWTIRDVVSDPLIRQVMEADEISSGELRDLLHKAREQRLTKRIRDER